MTSSSGTLRNVPGLGFLCMAKAAMDMFTKVLAREEGPCLFTETAQNYISYKK